MTRIFLSKKLSSTVIDVRRTVRNHFNVQTRCGQNYLEFRKYMKRSVLWSSIMNSGGLWLGYKRGVRLQGLDGEKHHVHSALNPSFVAESKVGS